MSHWGVESWTFGRELKGFRKLARDERGAVLLLHGYGEHAGRYGHVVEALADAGFSVYAYDQRGHGQSSGPRALVRMADLAEDHLAAREWLRAHVKTPVFALGHSMGGLVTAMSVVRDSRGLAGVILSSPALVTGQDAPPLVRRLAPLIALVAPSFPASVIEKGVLSRQAQVQEAFDADPLCYTGKVKARTGAEMMTAGHALWSQLDRWSLPTLVIHGDADRLITVEGSRRFLREVKSADVQYWEVAGGYHELFNDEGADEAIAKVTSWLNGHVQLRA
ncbi:alpha/beta hydrolase [Deinococcus yavapaiensis]|uniref:Alpha-beta hydrolase superfamily lysophospholipase n=1 Tax=Deinococcus yavapaiensis KR-236 TaxID=694435 RepID=A0A318SG06_9DEIO|nr:alpha/beta hydrolase [Deinococcus yavapaiensis]PYE52964.1 alpha-beta hydrolase superfamily lysophospholipase [Deinococcus yavapaiensis KR-236]